MQTITTKITPQLVHELDALVESGWYANRSEAVRDAIRILIERRNHTQLRAAIEDDIDWGLHGD